MLTSESSRGSTLNNSGCNEIKLCSFLSITSQAFYFKLFQCQMSYRCPYACYNI